MKRSILALALTVVAAQANAYLDEATFLKMKPDEQSYFVLAVAEASDDGCIPVRTSLRTMIGLGVEGVNKSKTGRDAPALAAIKVAFMRAFNCVTRDPDPSEPKPEDFSAFRQQMSAPLISPIPLVMRKQK